MILIGISGRAGSGKDAAATVLVEKHEFFQSSLADPLKRICADVFGWDPDRLWGPSELRNEPDPEWDGLTARRALQELGTSWGRAMHPDVWVRAALRRIENIEKSTGKKPRGYVIPDVRFKNEVTAIRKAGGKIIRIVRPGAGLTGDAGAHVSETELSDDDSSMYDMKIVNDGSLEQFETMIDALASVLGA